MKKIVVVNMVILSICSVIILFAPVKTKQFGDDTFHLEAKALVKFFRGESSINEVYITKAPGPTIWYSIPYFFVPSASVEIIYWNAGVIWNFFMMGGCTLLLIIFIYKYLNPIVAWIFLIVLYLIPVHLYYGMGILAEPIAFCGISVFTAGVIGLFTSSKTRWSILFLTIGLILLLTSRPNSLLVFLFSPLLFVYLYKVKKYRLSDLKNQFVAYFIAFGIFFCILFSVKQLPTYNKDNAQESYLFYVMHHGRFQFKTEKFDWRFWDPLTRPDSKDFQLWEQSSKELDEKVAREKKPFNDVYIEWLIKDTFENPGNFLLQSMVRFAFGNYLQISSINLDDNKVIKFGLYAVNLVNILILIGALLGFVKLYKMNKTWAFLYVPVISLLVFHMFIYMEQRYLFPLRPILLFTFSYFTYLLLNRIKFKDRV
jgi:hypothetical protein